MTATLEEQRAALRELQNSSMTGNAVYAAASAKFAGHAKAKREPLKDVSDAPVEPGFKEEAVRARALSSNR